jgi:hypothetical protein
VTRIASRMLSHEHLLFGIGLLASCGTGTLPTPSAETRVYAHVRARFDTLLCHLTHTELPIRQTARGPDHSRVTIPGAS